MNLVLDTNVLISAFIWGGTPRQVLEYAYRNHTLCFTDETLRELKTVLEYPHLKSELGKTGYTINEIVNTLTEKAIIKQTVPWHKIVIQEDPSDDLFLDCALTYRASHIISGDRHLLKLEKYQNVLIVTPKQFLKRAIQI